MVLLALVLLVGLVFLYSMMAPSATGMDMEAGELKVPTAEAGKSIPVLFGTHRIQNSNVVWWGDVKTIAIEESVSGGLFGGSEDVIVGYKYYVGLHLVLCTGMIEGISKIFVGDTIIWEDTLQYGRIYIDNANAFGGEKKEGGVQGWLNIERGTNDQARNSYLQAQLGSDCPAFRYLGAIIAEQIYFGTGAYMKPWSFLTTRRHLSHWADPDAAAPWYIAKQNIGTYDVNPIHIIYNVLTSQEHGKGMSTTYIDDASFRAAADIIYDEGLGLSFLWSADMEPEEFIGEVLKHIDGLIYQDMSTGKFVIALARDDYTVSALDTYDEDEIIEIDDFKRPALKDIPNWVVVKYHDLLKNEDDSVTAHDLALIDQQSNIVPVEHNRPGITQKDIANDQAFKLLKQYSAMLATMTIKGNRNFAGVRPNDMIKISYSLLGMVSVPVRVLSIDYGDLVSGEIKIHCTEDVFSAGEGIYETPTDSLWTTPTNPPSDPTYFNLFEMSYGMMLAAGFRTQALLDIRETDEGFVAVAVAKPTVDAIDYNLWLKYSAGDSFEDFGYMQWTPTATIADSGGVDQEVTQSVVTLEGIIDLNAVPDNSYALMGTEMVEVVSVDTVNSQITIKRGLFDTVPQFHTFGTRVWFVKTLITRMNNVYTDGDTPSIKPLTRTAQGVLAIGDATERTMTPAFDSRMIRPYAPGNFKINTVSYPASFSGQPALTWSHRNRLTQVGDIIDASEAGAFALETGEYYTLKIYDASSGGGLLRTETPITDGFYTYAELDERSDGGLGSADPLHTSLRFVLSSHRVDSSGGTPFDSWQEIDFTISRV